MTLNEGMIYFNVISHVFTEQILCLYLYMLYVDWCQPVINSMVHKVEFDITPLFSGSFNLSMFTQTWT
jgi:hypothetical protein